MNYHNFISSVLNGYSPVGRESISKIKDLAELIHIQKNESLLKIGEQARHIYFIIEGSVVSYYLNENGDLYHKNIFLPGDLIGSTVALIKGAPSQFALESIENSRLLKLNYTHYRELLFSRDDLKNFYIAYLEQNWVIDKEKREVEIVLNQAKDRYSELLRKHPGLENKIPLNLIASNLGITPTQLSRIRKSLHKKP